MKTVMPDTLALLVFTILAVVLAQVAPQLYISSLRRHLGNVDQDWMVGPVTVLSTTSFIAIAFCAYDIFYLQSLAVMFFAWFVMFVVGIGVGFYLAIYTKKRFNLVGYINHA